MSNYNYSNSNLEDALGRPLAEGDEVLIPVVSYRVGQLRRTKITRIDTRTYNHRPGYIEHRVYCDGMRKARPPSEVVLIPKEPT